MSKNMNDCVIKTQALKEIDVAINRPKKWKVILLNDDITPMDFVVMILMDIFNKSNEEATNLMLKVHNNGSAVVGIYVYEIAETKVQQVEMASQQAGYPLRVIMERN